TIDVLRKIPEVIENADCPIDVEFLIAQKEDLYELNIVQARKLSPVHLNNYLCSQNFPMSNIAKQVLIPESFIYHSVGRFKGRLCTGGFKSRWMKNDLPNIFMVKHDSGEGLFRFLEELPKDFCGVGLIVTHPEMRTHDHLQYSVYEDPRFSFVLHVEDSAVSNLKDGMILKVTSNGKRVSIEEQDEIVIDGIHINFIHSLDEIDESLVSAVFLVGFMGEEIIAGRNERGWDILGGHLEERDVDLLSGLQRESFEEGRVKINSTIPFATIRFEGREDLMVFYTSSDCELLPDFVPKNDAYDRALMKIQNFLEVYYWKEDIMATLIKEAMNVLGLNIKF
ncbi:MAG: hypothetical protein AAB438_00870, partial [Patescibacteria group bacterium]